VPPPNLPPRPPSPQLDRSQPDPYRRGAQTPPAASDRNSYPVDQGPDDEVNGQLRAGPTQDPRRGAALSRPFSALPPTPTRPSHIPSQCAYIHTASEQLSLGTSTPSTPTLPQPPQLMHPSRLAHLETSTFGPAITGNSEPTVIAAPTPRPHPSLSIQPIPVPRSEVEVPSTPTKPPGMHPDRVPFLSTNSRSSSAVSPTQPSLHATPNGSQQYVPSEEHFVDRSLSTFLTNETVPPRDERIASSSRVTLDDLVPSHAHGFSNLAPSFSTSFNQHFPPQTHKTQNQSPNQNKKGKAAQKRKASEALLPPRPPKSPKIQRGKSGNGNNVSVPGPAGIQGKALKKKWRKRKGKGKGNGQPGPSNSRRDKPDYDPGRSHALGRM